MIFLLVPMLAVLARWRPGRALTSTGGGVIATGAMMTIVGEQGCLGEGCLIIVDVQQRSYESLRNVLYIQTRQSKTEGDGT